MFKSASSTNGLMNQSPPLNLNASDSSCSRNSEDDDGEEDDDEEGQSSVNTENEMDRVRKLVSDEAFRVRSSRMLVFLTLLGTGTIVCVLVFAVLLFQNESDIVEEFNGFVDTIEQDFHHSIENLFNANRELSTAITVEALKYHLLHQQQQDFPYLSVPFFEAFAHDARMHAAVDLAFYGPVANDLAAWKNFSMTHSEWIQESLQVSAQLFDSDLDTASYDLPKEPNDGVVMTMTPTGEMKPLDESLARPFLPVLHYSPPLLQYAGYQNLDLFSIAEFRNTSRTAAKLQDVTFSPFMPLLAQLVQSHDTATHRVFGASMYPVFRTLQKGTENVVGFILMSIAWDSYFDHSLPEKANNMVILLNNTCGQSVAFEISRGKVVFKGHDIKYKDADLYRPTILKKVVKSSKADLYNIDDAEVVNGRCTPFLEVMALNAFAEDYSTNLRYVVTIGIGGVSFGLMGLVFILFDKQAKQQEDTLAKHAAQSNTVLASLFPSTVRDKLFNNEQKEEKEQKDKNFKRLVEDDDDDFPAPCDPSGKHNVIADLYPETTILFADIAGFTAWSSMQEPKQVFILLETIFGAFDEIAQRRRIFKIETVGDCYVAASGLPTRRKEHAVAMCRFARDCMYRMWRLSKELEVTLGPTTGDLAMRMGIHSGPVTAGVLRGDRLRFQVFGDTMNTASRIESSGRKNCIHISADTADLLVTAGKGSWIKPREDHVVAKGKGELKTFWLEIGAVSDFGSRGTSSVADSTTDASNSNDHHAARSIGPTQSLDNDKFIRLIDWNVDILSRLLKGVVGRREALSGSDQSSSQELSLVNENGLSVLDEVQEIIRLPSGGPKDSAPVAQLDDEVASQLRHFVTSVCAMYRDNAFHNFEHASHMLMGVTKLLSRVVEDKGKSERSGLHEPLTQFACALSALIHDLDHSGVPNAQLVREKTDRSRYYNGRSIAEQNSVDLAFALFMDKQFDALRCAIYADETEMRVFRQLVINAVMATDIADKELKDLRNARWEKAFSTDDTVESHPLDSVHRKATIVIEHLMQASDVGHTMQHWHIYRMWNERFFMECYKAFIDGRAESNPADNWYNGEMDFFDFYIIPLARKLKDCGVFGVSSDEYLNYAVKNRTEWELKGREIVAEMVETCKMTYHK